MKSPYNGGNNTPTRHHIPPNKTPVPGIGHIILSCWPVVPISPTHGIGYAPQLGCMSLLLRIPHTCIIEHGEAEPVLRGFPPLASVHGAGSVIPDTRGQQ